MIRKVAVIMGSDSDWPVVKGACAQLKALDIPFEAHILSAHRTPAEAADFAKNARANGFGVILCAAGMAAHTPPGSRDGNADVYIMHSYSLLLICIDRFQSNQRIAWLL